MSRPLIHTTKRIRESEAYTPRPHNNKNSLVGAFNIAGRLLITPGRNLLLVALNLAICAYSTKLWTWHQTYHHF